MTVRVSTASLTTRRHQSALRIDLHVYVHHDPAADGATTRLEFIIAQLEDLKMGNKDVKTQMDRIEAATTAAANRIAVLIAKVGTGMTDEEVKEVVTGLTAEADALEAMGKDPDNPVVGG